MRIPGRPKTEILVLEDPDTERIPEAFADAIHDAVNALQVAVLLAAEVNAGR